MVEVYLVNFTVKFSFILKLLSQIGRKPKPTTRRSDKWRAGQAFSFYARHPSW